jgi:SMC interacting uncharacterized protein involved in chromosome segregation
MNVEIENLKEDIMIKSQELKDLKAQLSESTKKYFESKGIVEVAKVKINIERIDN